MSDTHFGLDDMCDETTFARDRRIATMTRRRFGALTAAAGAVMLLPKAAKALDVTFSEVDVETPDGTADCYFARPVEDAHPGVVIWPDARGMRGAYRDMAVRLAEHGYSVLVVNPYYRRQRGQVLPDDTDPRQGNAMSVLGPLLADLSPETERTDAIAAIEWLDAHENVADDRKLGTIGFCLGGPATFRTAAEAPTRVGAAASFHGVRLVTDEPTSPHRLVPRLDAQFLIAIAEDDDARDPDAKNVLRAAFDEAEVSAEIEVYPAMHSWMTTDSAVHDPAQAERGWNRMLALFAAALA